MIAELKADLARFPGSTRQRWMLALANPGVYALAVYRFGRDVYHRWPRALRIPGKILYRVLAFFSEWFTGIALSPAASIGPGLYIGHWGGIRVGPEVRIGANCNISPMVVFGFGMVGGKRGVPCLCDRVYVAAGAKIVGPIRVGNDVAIGANAVVCRDVPDHVSVGGVPARIISRKGSADYLQVGQPIDVRPARVNEVKVAEAARDPQNAPTSI